jgi:hypothetical protein
MAMIQKKIFTIWIGEIPMPEAWNEFVETHDIAEYEHKIILLEDAKRIAQEHKIKYLQEAIDAKKFIKVTDYLRVWLLWSEGGIYLDCDMQVLKPFDDLLNTGIFVGRENNRVIANSIIGAEKGHPLLKKYLDIVESNFKGSGDMVFEPAERLFTDLVLGTYGNFEDIITYSSDYFFPMNEITKEEKITKNTHTYHHFARSWKK